GATIHLAVEKVDAGSVLGQVRPEASPGDRAHELGTKTLIAALNALPQILAKYERGEIVPQGQDLTQGKVFKRKDFTPGSVRQMWQKLEQGMIPNYLSNLAARNQQYPVVG